MGRTGTWWGHQQLTDAQPDLLLFAKGIASGFPFAGVSARPHLYDKMSPGMMVREGRQEREVCMPRWVLRTGAWVAGAC